MPEYRRKRLRQLLELILAGVIIWLSSSTISLLVFKAEVNTKLYYLEKEISTLDLSVSENALFVDDIKSLDAQIKNVMTTNWDLRRVVVNCPNDDCSHSGRLKDFVDIEEGTYPIDKEFVLEGVCPKCGQPVRLTIELHIDYYVWEEKS